MVYQGHIGGGADGVVITPHHSPSFPKGGEDHKDQGPPQSDVSYSRVQSNGTTHTHTS